MVAAWSTIWSAQLNRKISFSSTWHLRILEVCSQIYLNETLGTKMQILSKVILPYWVLISLTFPTVWSEIDGIFIGHHTFRLSLNWRWISIHLTHFAVKNQISARISYLIVITNRINLYRKQINSANNKPVTRCSSESYYLKQS